MTRVAVFVGTRADFNPLGPVIAALSVEPGLETHVITGLAFSSADLRSDDTMARLTDLQFHDITDPIQSMSAAGVVDHGADMARGTAAFFDRVRPDVVVLLGDRWELLWIASTAYLSEVRIVHLHGGEVTEGAIDDRVRHAVTKLSDQHCVASSDAAERLFRMGEPPARVHVTGAPGLDRLQGARSLPDDDLGQVLGCDVRRPLTIFTYHPCAGNEGDSGQHAGAALRGTLAATGDGTVIVTHPGFDDGRDEVLAALLGVAAGQPRAVVVEALGAAYPAVLASADLVVGNSSSGVIEAATFGLPVVDIGIRQAGRLRASNVMHSDDGSEAVARAVAAALTPEFRQQAADVENPYGNGQAARHIVQVVSEACAFPRLKGFTE